MEQIVFAQITDTHIGRKLLGNKMTRGVPFAGGYNPHDDKLFESLNLALEDAGLITGLKDQEPLRIVMGGDLTAGGTDNDFAIAASVFFRRWLWRKGSPNRCIGYRFDERNVVMVPGNHDHWGNDYWQQAYRQDLFPAFFQQTPWRTDWFSRNGRLRLELYGVDSNSGMTGLPLNNNLFAGGKLSTLEQHRLAALLQASQAENVQGVVRVRCLVCHHALDNGILSMPRPLDRLDQRYLSCLAARYRIPAVLTGHTHEFDLVHFLESSSDDAAWVLREFRSAAALAGPADPGSNGFWVHRIALPDGADRPVWTSWKYQTGRPLEFELEDENGSVTFPVPA